MAMTPEQQRIVDAAARHNLTDADIDSLSGLNTELAKQVNGLTWLLRTSQSETAGHQADAERLRAELVAALNAPPPATSTTTVSSATITLSDGRTETLMQ